MLLILCIRDSSTIWIPPELAICCSNVQLPDFNSCQSIQVIGTVRYIVLLFCFSIPGMMMIPLDQWWCFTTEHRSIGTTIDSSHKDDLVLIRFGLQANLEDVLSGWWFHTFSIIYWERSSQLTFIFFRGVGQPPTSSAPRCPQWFFFDTPMKYS